jgi:molybdenum cofactor cytidylyltransferase
MSDSSNEEPGRRVAMISAIVPAAGLSSRMGGPLPKPLLPWGASTVLGTVVSTLLAAGVTELIVVTGHRRESVEAALAGSAVRCVYNPAYTGSEMLSSIQAGLAAASPASAGALLALADQPQMELAVLQQVLRAFADSGGQALVIPSHALRRGHPILLPRWLWDEVLALPAGDTLRSAIQRYTAAIRYVEVDTPTVLADLDTPEQYAAAAPAQPGEWNSPSHSTKAPQGLAHPAPSG